MLAVERSNRFKKDYKLMKKRGKDLQKLKSIIAKLANREKLEEKNRDHQLLGDYVHARECHIEGDWLLIYVILNDAIRLERTGTHSDLFE